MRVAITGSSGLIGTALRKALSERGDEVTRVVRRTPRAGQIAWDPAAGTIDSAGLEGHDAVVHLAAESIAGIWTADKKRRIRESRVTGTRVLAQALARLEHKPTVLISASGVDVYGDHDPDEPVTEATPAGRGFLAEVVVEWEAATRAAEEAGVRVVHTRNGLVLSADGGAFAVMLPAFRLGLGATLGSGTQPFPWVALDDVVHAVLFAIERSALSGPVNVVAPEAVDNERFTRTLADVLRRPAFFRIPAFALRLVPGGMGEELLLEGARVIPQKLLDAGYVFRQPTLRGAIEAALS